MNNEFIKPKLHFHITDSIIDSIMNMEEVVLRRNEAGLLGAVYTNDNRVVIMVTTPARTNADFWTFGVSVAGAGVLTSKEATSLAEAITEATKIVDWLNSCELLIDEDEKIDGRTREDNI